MAIRKYKPTTPGRRGASGSDFSGVVRVTSTKSATDEPRRPGVVGLYLRIAMISIL
jgi:ribosomal protein L2